VRRHHLHQVIVEEVAKWRRIH